MEPTRLNKFMFVAVAAFFVFEVFFRDVMLFFVMGYLTCLWIVEKYPLLDKLLIEAEDKRRKTE